jgi:hypothetical protein
VRSTTHSIPVPAIQRQAQRLLAVTQAVAARSTNRRERDEQRNRILELLCASFDQSDAGLQVSAVSTCK